MESNGPAFDVAHKLGERSSDAEKMASSQSDSDSDLEPEELVDKYLGIQRRLYEINPRSFEQNGKIQKVSKMGRSSQMEVLDRNVKRTVDRLAAKLSRIKTDILFDEGEAQQRWAEMQIDLAKEAAERRRLGMGNESGSTKQTTKTDGLKQAQNGEKDEDAIDLLGDLFSSNSTPADGGEPDGGGIGNTPVMIRDFGKWTGMSPRRVFEEACKSRQGFFMSLMTKLTPSIEMHRHALHTSRSPNRRFQSATLSQ